MSNFTEHAHRRLEERYGNFSPGNRQEIKRLCFDDRHYKLIRTDFNVVETREIDFNGMLIHALVKPSSQTIITFLPPNQLSNIEYNATEANNAVKIFALEKTVKLLMCEINEMKQSKTLNHTIIPDGRFINIEQQLASLKKKVNILNTVINNHEYHMFSHIKIVIHRIDRSIKRALRIRY